MNAFNPFAWSGPAFLGFYAALTLVILAYCWLRTRWRGAEASPAKVRITEMTSDPYRIACLRDGEPETIRVAMFNLLDRGLLRFDGMTLATSRDDSPAFVRRGIDGAILEACRRPRWRNELMSYPTVRVAARAYCRELAAKGLLAQPDEEKARARLMFGA